MGRAPARRGQGSGAAAVYTKVAAVCVWLPSFAIAGAAAWIWWRTLNEIGPLHRHRPTTPRSPPRTRAGAN